MKESKKLTIGMAAFTILLFISFGVIITTEKLSPYFAPRIEKKIVAHVKKEYQNQLEEVKLGKAIYKNTKYQLKVSNKENKNLYFTVTYDKKKITDTYQKDYKEGTTLLKTLQQDLEKKLTKSQKEPVKIHLLTTLNKLSEQLQKKIITDNKIEDLKIYTLETTITTDWSLEPIIAQIKKLETSLTKKGYTPKNISVTITNKKDLTEEVKINNLTEESLEQTVLTQIVTDILNNKNSTLLKEYNVTYQYLNKGE